MNEMQDLRLLRLIATERRLELRRSALGRLGRRPGRHELPPA